MKATNEIYLDHIVSIVSSFEFGQSTSSDVFLTIKPASSPRSAVITRDG